MAIMGTPTSLTVTPQERSSQVRIDAPFGGDPSVNATREMVRVDASGNLIGRDSAPMLLPRYLSKVHGDSVAFTPSQSGKITGAEMAQCIADFIDMWRQQDIDAAAALADAEPPAQ